MTNGCYRKCVQSTISGVAETTERQIHELIQCESSIFTLNEKDFLHHRKRFLRIYQKLDRESRGEGSLISAAQNLDPEARPGNTLDAQKQQHWKNIIGSLAALGITNVTAQDLVRALPPSKSSAELEVMANVRAYFESEPRAFVAVRDTHAVHAQLRIDDLET